MEIGLKNGQYTCRNVTEMNKSKRFLSAIKRLFLAVAMIYSVYLTYGFIVIGNAYKMQMCENDLRRMAHSLIEFRPRYGIDNRESPQPGDGAEWLDANDPWGNAVQFYWNTNTFVLAYAGKDKKIGTPDDMAIKYEWWDLEKMGKFPQRFVGEFTGWHTGLGGGTHIVSYKGGSQVLRTAPDYLWTNWNHITGHKRGR